MYVDLSLTPTSMIEIKHLLKTMPEESYSQAALDYQFVDIGIGKIPENFINLQNEEKHMKIYSRATLVVENTATLHQLSQNNCDFDVVAVKPKNEKIFHSVCVDYENYDIITFDTAVKMPFMLKRNPVYEALRKGKYFEIQYQGMFDQETRIICMTNIINIFKATNGKQLILSSHADNYQKHRTPFDISALLVSLGMNKNLVLPTMKENAENVIKTAIHRKFFKGTIKEVSDVVVKKISKRIQKHRNQIKQILKKKQKQ